MGGGAEAICAVDVTGAVGVRGSGGKWFRVSNSETLNLGLVGFGPLLFVLGIGPGQNGFVHKQKCDLKSKNPIKTQKQGIHRHANKYGEKRTRGLSALRYQGAADIN
ncbi:hypothetical protein ES332_A02G035600v1 [Gossypium tomentosum]|uniref:Uncharacterized protein n=1 Tax=Gossypium tomentosum TaxID=34277 RepID=A0A5D2RCI9_GOSTO|nr:hypothetical protein ES332_A02G035600v1 [Gossypium tomentosum]